MPTKFCPNCNNILDISKNPPKYKNIHHEKPEQTENVPTPSTMSDVNDIESETKIEETEDKLYMDVINKLNNDEEIPDSMLSEIKMDQLIKNKLYQQLDKKTKSQFQAKLMSYNDKVDDAVSAYYYCKNCMYFKTIEAGSLIISRTNGVSSNNYMNLDRLKNRIYSKILPITRDYICINEKCPTNTKNETKEAVFFRVSGSMQVWYTCKLCNYYWKGQ